MVSMIQRSSNQLSKPTLLAIVRELLICVHFHVVIANTAFANGLQTMLLSHGYTAIDIHSPAQFSFAKNDQAWSHLALLLNSFPSDIIACSEAGIQLVKVFERTLRWRISWSIHKQHPPGISDQNSRCRPAVYTSALAAAGCSAAAVDTAMLSARGRLWL
jgi:hypothetical protein